MLGNSQTMSSAADMMEDLLPKHTVNPAMKFHSLGQFGQLQHNTAGQSALKRGWPQSCFINLDFRRVLLTQHELRGCFRSFPALVRIKTHKKEFLEWQSTGEMCKKKLNHYVSHWQNKHKAYTLHIYSYINTLVPRFVHCFSADEKSMKMVDGGEIWLKTNNTEYQWLTESLSRKA